MTHPSRDALVVRSLRACAALVVTGALLVTLALTIARLTDPRTKYGVLLAALTPVGTVTALVAGLATVPLLWLPARPGRAARVAAGAATVLCALHLWWLAPLYIGPRVQAAGDGRVVLMTQNFESGDATRLEQTVLAQHVDVLVICDAGEAQSAAASRVADRVGLLHRVTDRGTAVYSRYPIAGTTRISDGGSSRVVRLTGTPLGDLTLYAVHPAPGYDAAKWAADHRRIETVLRASRPQRSVIAGDLNATLDNAPLRRIGDFGYTDAAVQTRSGWQPTWPADGVRPVAGIAVPRVLQLDHVLTSNDLAVTGVHRVDLPGADHNGVVAAIARRVPANP